MLLLGTVNETHYMLSIQHTATAMDDEVVFRIVGTEYNVNLEVLSKALTEHPGGEFYPSNVFGERSVCTNLGYEYAGRLVQQVDTCGSFYIIIPCGDKFPRACQS